MRAPSQISYLKKGKGLQGLWGAFGEPFCLIEGYQLFGDFLLRRVTFGCPFVCCWFLLQMLCYFVQVAYETEPCKCLFISLVNFPISNITFLFNYLVFGGSNTGLVAFSPSPIIRPFVENSKEQLYLPDLIS